MKSKVHPRYKTKYRVANWAGYNRALVRRGDVTVWLSAEAIAAWTPGRSGRRGGQRRYSEALLHESSRARTMPTARILTGRCDSTLVGRGRSSDSGSRSRGRPHSPARLGSGREDHRR